MIKLAGIVVLASAGLLTAETAHGFGGRLFSFHHAACYRQSVTVLYVPVYPVTPVYCQPEAAAAAPKMMYAIPRPAPASQTAEPPASSNSTPAKRDTQSLGGEYSKGDRCKVGFWNLSGRELTIKVDGANRVVPRDRAVMLELGREFVWQAEGREPNVVRVPPGQTTHEVVLR